ncbi:hypothetical protein KFE25_005391 [Diacronema lutheri]|uniref:EF-hand domain-containing protein n=2 Tax=Diacronema lutheri TaxID=2081491 RepID=A0A8J5XBV6_DIALT|nr:hypothetical protein KFE25_005391 [Diacronema lutheri]
MAAMNDAQVAQLEKVFKSFDADGSGALSTNEVEEVVYALGMALTKTEIANMITSADRDKDGQIDFLEMRRAMEATLGMAERDGRLGSFAHLVTRKSKTGPPLRWTEAKVGDRVVISADKKVASRDAADGWGVQLLDAWLASAGDVTYNVADVMLAVEDVSGGNLMVGVVGRNFWPSDWNQPLAGNKHAVVTHAEAGAVWRKQIKTDLLLGAVQPGMRIHILIEMLRQEMTIDLLAPDNTLVRSVSIGDLPPELTVAICMGPGAQKVRLVGSSTDTAVGEFLGKTNKDLWDDDNVQRLETEKKENPASEEAVAASLE